MIVLALETASLDVGVALADETGPLAVLSTRAGRKHAETLHPMVEEACRLADVVLGDLGAVAVDVGPGLFTGIRVGLAAAKGFAFALGLPLVGLTSLEILHAGMTAASAGGAVMAPMVDLRRGEVAWALGRPGEPLSAPRLSAAEDAAGELAGLVAAGERVLAAGDGARRYAELFEPRIVVAGPELAAPPVASLSVRAVGVLGAGEASDPMGVKPVYLREPDARINWSKMHEGLL